MAIDRTRRRNALKCFRFDWTQLERLESAQGIESSGILGVLRDYPQAKTALKQPHPRREAFVNAKQSTPK